MPRMRRERVLRTERNAPRLLDPRGLVIPAKAGTYPFAAILTPRRLRDALT